MTACPTCRSTGRVIVGYLLGQPVWGDCPNHPVRPPTPPASPPECPWPAKTAHPDKTAAVRQRADMIRGGADPDSLTAYRCPAKHWHVGNRSRFAKLDERIPPRRGRSRR